MVVNWLSGEVTFFTVLRIKFRELVFPVDNFFFASFVGCEAK